MPASIIQKLIVCPVLEKMTKPLNERDVTPRLEPENVEELLPTQSSNLMIPNDTDSILSLDHDGASPPMAQFESIDSYNKTSIEACQTPKKKKNHSKSDCRYSSSSESEMEEKAPILRLKWTDEEKKLIYNEFGEAIILGKFPQRKLISDFFNLNIGIFQNRSLSAMVTFIHNKCLRKQKNVTPEVKKFMTNDATTQKSANKTHRRLTNVPL